MHRMNILFGKKEIQLLEKIDPMSSRNWLIRKAVKDRDRISDITDMCASMEMWRIREYITYDFLIHYIRLHIPCEKESTVLLTNLCKRVETRLKRKRNVC